MNPRPSFSGFSADYLGKMRAVEWILRTPLPSIPRGKVCNSHCSGRQTLVNSMTETKVVQGCQPLSVDKQLKFIDHLRGSVISNYISLCNSVSLSLHLCVALGILTTRRWRPTPWKTHLVDLGGFNLR